MGSSYAGDAFADVAGDAPVSEAQRATADYQIVRPTYFETLDLPIVAGRAFADRDTSKSPPVCIVNEAFVRRHLLGRSPLGLQIAGRSAVSPTDSARCSSRRSPGSRWRSRRLRGVRRESIRPLRCAISKRLREPEYFGEMSQSARRVPRERAQQPVDLVRRVVKMR
jgi:hypothetical protein